MLTQSRITTILPVADVPRARRFYEEKLGLRTATTRPDGAVVLEGDQGALELLPRPEAKATGYTVASFEVPDVVGQVKELERRGVRFEDYDLPDLKTVDHVCVMGAERAAWFKDPEGNVLCIHDGGHTEH
jgi:catechol 2,3-dioxygenase-like lactoylglutathione lyase family enzyme